MPPSTSATYQCLRHYIAERIRMSHIDQPLMLIELLELCHQRLDAFREQRGEEVFTHRRRHRSPISGSVK